MNREQRYYEFKLDVYRQTGNRQTDRPGPRGGPTRGGPPKNQNFTPYNIDKKKEYILTTMLVY